VTRARLVAGRAPARRLGACRALCAPRCLIQQVHCLRICPPPRTIHHTRAATPSACPRLQAPVSVRARARRRQAARFQNDAMCRLTEQVVFSDPYRAAPVNRHTSPQLDAEAAALRADAPAKTAAAALKVRRCILSAERCCLGSGPAAPHAPLVLAALVPARATSSWQCDVLVAGGSAGHQTARARCCWGCQKRLERRRAR
jgi:hypothetical protein